MPIEALLINRCCTGVGIAGAASITSIAVTASIANAVVIGTDDDDAIGLSASIRGCQSPSLSSRCCIWCCRCRLASCTPCATGTDGPSPMLQVLILPQVPVPVLSKNLTITLIVKEDKIYSVLMADGAHNLLRYEDEMLRPHAYNLL